MTSTPNQHGRFVNGPLFRAIAIAFMAVGLLLVVPTQADAGPNGQAAFVVASAQTAGVAGPPGAPCGSPVWTTSVSFDPNGWPIASTRFGSGSGLVGSATVGGLAYPAGSVTVTITTWDGHPIRAEQSQVSESVRLEFDTAAGVVATAYTPDLADNVPSASSTTNVGTYSLPTGATAVRIVHAGGAGQNSLVATAVCVNFVPAPPVTTVVPVTTVPPATTVVSVTTVPPATTVVPVTTVPPATTVAPATTVVPATTVPPVTTVPPATTVTPATTVPPVASTSAPLQPEPDPDPVTPEPVEPEASTEVLGETELPRTGFGPSRLIGLAFVMIGLGLFVTSTAARREEAGLPRRKA